MDFDAVKSAMPTLVPMVGTLGLQFDELNATTAVLRLPDQAAFHNHIGGPHAGAMFTLGESASGALVLGNFADHLSAVTPLAVEANIAYQKVAMGTIVATAVMTRTAQEVLTELESGSRPEFVVDITLATEDGTVTGRMGVTWTLKPNAPRQ